MTGGLTTGHAQTRFVHPDTTPDLTRYRTVFQCLAASNRTTSAFKRALPYWIDTTEAAPNDVNMTTPPPTIDIARRCRANFNMDSVSIDYWTYWMQLALLADYDDSASSMMQRRLRNARWIKDDTLGRPALLERALYTFLGARPMRWDQARAIVAELEKNIAVVGTMKVLEAYVGLIGAAREFDDTSAIQEVVPKILDLSERLTPEERKSRLYQMALQLQVAFAHDWVDRVELQNNLRLSVSAYVAKRRANWIKSHGDTNSVLIRRIGEHAKPIEATIWVGTDDAPATSLTGATFATMNVGQRPPTRGKPALLVFIGSGCRDDVSSASHAVERLGLSARCMDTYAAIRRLKNRTPDLEVTIVATTQGHVGEVGPLKPEEEARLLKSWLLDHHRLPATIALTAPESFRLSDPDRRIIAQPTKNDINYHLKYPVVEHKYTFLIAPSGEVIYYDRLGRWSEREFRVLIEAMTK